MLVNKITRTKKKGHRNTMSYFDELKKSMDWLSEKPDTLFLYPN